MPDTNSTSNASIKVLVTGASGFIAKHIVRELLDSGYRVRGSVRSDRRKAELDALFGIDTIEYAHLDLSADDGWSVALDGIDVLVHTASPFPAEQPKDPQELIRPAVDGTLRALRAAHAAGVHRVILTSSCAAIYKDASKPKAAQATAEHWTDADGADTTAYEASKTLAERAAWDFVEQHPGMQLTTVCPGGVFGPAMDTNYGTSLEIIEQILNRAFPMYPDINLPIVDVRDVARIHVAAIDQPDSIGRRLVANAGALTMVEVATLFSKAYPGRKIATRQAPNLLVRIGARFNPVMKIAAANLGRKGDVDGTPTEELLGFTYIPSKDAILASADFLTTHGK